MTTLSIRARIRLAIGLLGAGFVALLLLVQFTGMQTQTGMRTASGSWFPATLSSQEAGAAFQKLTKSYSDAVLFQDKGALAQSDDLARGVESALQSARQKTAFSPERQKQVEELLTRFSELHARAKIVYGGMIDSRGSVSQETETAVAALAQDLKQMEASLLDLRKTLSGDFQAQLDGVTSWSNRQRLFGVVLFLLVASCAAAMTVMVERRVGLPLQSLTARLNDIAEGEGDLTQRIPVNSGDEIGELSRGFNTFLDKLQGIIGQVKIDTEHVASASEEIASSATQMARGSETQQSQTAQVATAMHEMASSVADVSANANKVADEARNAALRAREGGQVVDKAVGMMRSVADSVGRVAQQITELGKRSDQIGRIVSVIDEIADQTNLLALNAAIEAARAGEQGRGFAVVADEVRKLAERTTKATKEIADMIAAIQQETKTAVQAMERGTAQVKEGVSTTAEAGTKLQQIIRGSETAADMITQIATAANQQTSTTDEINASIGDIARISQESASGSRQSAKACEDLSALAFALQSLVSKFKVEVDREPDRQAARRPPLPSPSIKRRVDTPYLVGKSNGQAAHEGLNPPSASVHQLH
jgi:methyl-accepting chemotaxis protein